MKVGSQEGEAAMTRIACLASIVTLVLGLSACDVSVHDETPAQFTANDRFGMYPIKAEIARDALVSPDAVILTALIDDQPLALEGDQAETDWQALYPIRCHPSFTLQYRAAWTVQGLASRYKLIPERPKTVRLLEPPLTKDVKVDTSARSRKGWTGDVEYVFVTEPNTQISALRIEPLSPQPQDVKAAAPISVTTQVPVSAACDKPVDIALLSKAQHARGYLVIETNNPSLPMWRTEVDFGPS
jgi:hypothetical protein